MPPEFWLLTPGFLTISHHSTLLIFHYSWNSWLLALCLAPLCLSSRCPTAHLKYEKGANHRNCLLLSSYTSLISSIFKIRIKPYQLPIVLLDKTSKMDQVAITQIIERCYILIFNHLSLYQYLLIPPAKSIIPTDKICYWRQLVKN